MKAVEKELELSYSIFWQSPDQHMQDTRRELAIEAKSVILEARLTHRKLLETMGIVEAPEDVNDDDIQDVTTSMSHKAAAPQTVIDLEDDTHLLTARPNLNLDVKPNLDRKPLIGLS
jgi:hypothetical protein